MNFIDMYKAYDEGKTVQRVINQYSDLESDSPITSIKKQIVITYKKQELLGEICHLRKNIGYDGRAWFDCKLNPFFYEEDYAATDWEVID